MATTTNYSWTTPDDTDLVKDGAAAIRTLGTAIDTTVFTNAGAAINKSLVDAAGDLIYGTADNTVARLAIGTADQVLKVNSGATAPEWGTAPSGGMTLISTTTFTGASVTLSSIPATYNDLRVIIRLSLPATDGANLWVRVNGDSGASRHEVIVSSNANNDGGTARSFSRAEWRFTYTADNAVTNSLAVMDIFDYANATTWKMCNFKGFVNNNTTTTSFNIVECVGVYNQTAAISSLQFLMNTGNATSGTILLYGVK